MISLQTTTDLRYLPQYGDGDKEYCRCPLCDADDHSVLDLERGLAIVQCRQCDMIYTNPRALHSEKSYFYDKDFFYSEAALIFQGKKPHHRDRNYIYELELIKKIKRSGKLLDVGTNMGFFLRKAKAMGFETEGVEPSPQLCEIASEQFGLKMHNAFLQEAKLPSEHYDVITLIDVFEHVVDPRSMLHRCAALLKPDGIIAVKVPNGDYTRFKMMLAHRYGLFYNQGDIWDCGEHVSHYTLGTFTRMAEHCGFRVVYSGVPLPIHTPVWHNYVGKYYQYPSPFFMDWKRIILRNLFYYAGKLEHLLGFRKLRFAPDLMFIIQKNTK